MNNRALTLSLVMAAMAIFFVQSYVSSIEEDARKKNGAEVLVVVAGKDIQEMQTIDETVLTFKQIPDRFREKTAIVLLEKESSKGLKELAGSIAIVPIKKGEQITYTKITEPSMRTGLASQIAPGRRAITLPVSETTGVAKLVKPGDRVDLIAIMDLGGGKVNRIAKTVLQDVVVLSIGRYVTNNVARTIEMDASGGKDKVRSLAEDFSFSSVNLEVEPAQAQMIALLLSGDNTITLSLRNNDDIERVNLQSTVFSDVLGADMSRVQGGNVQKK